MQKNKAHTTQVTESDKFEIKLYRHRYTVN